MKSTIIIDNVLKKENTFLYILYIKSKFSHTHYNQLISEINLLSHENIDFIFLKFINDNFSGFMEFQRILYRAVCSHYDSKDLLNIDLSEFIKDEQNDIYDLYDLVNDLSLKIIKLLEHYSKFQ